MKADEIDKIIAEALEADRKEKGKRNRRTSNRDVMGIVRKVLNTVFMIGFVAAIVIYFALPEQRLLFFSVGFGALVINLIEFFIRFVLLK